MAAAARRIFLERLSLERLFDAIPDLIARTRTGLALTPLPDTGPAVELVVALDTAATPDAVGTLLRRVAAQTQASVTALLAYAEDHPARSGVEAAAAGHQVRTVIVPAAAPYGSVLWAGLRAVRAPWFGVATPGTEIFPNHVATLLAAADAAGAAAVLAGTLVEAGAGPKAIGANEVEVLALPRLGHLGVADAPAAWIARREVLGGWLRQDPGLGAGALSYIGARVTAGAACSWLVTARTTPVHLGEAETGRLRDLARLEPPRADAARGEPPRSKLRVTGLDDQNPELAASVPFLVGFEDFRDLPADRPILVYGASRGGRLVQIELSKWDHLRVEGFLDSFAEGDAWGLPIGRVADLTPERRENAVFIIASQYVSQIVRTLREAGIRDIRNAAPFIMAQTEKRRD